MSDEERTREVTDDEQEADTPIPQRSVGKPTNALFNMMENEAGPATPEQSNLSNFTHEFVYNELSPKDYHSSNFPSLISHLGPNAIHKTKRGTRNRQTTREDGFKHVKREKTQLTFAENMRRKNEATWNRIESVAKEKMEYYERYVSEMTQKLKQQRSRINKRSNELLKSLERQEEKKKEDKMFASSYGRIWRHQRTMQRRAFSLEPMRSHNITLASVNKSEPVR